jgi:hypothetical protein
LQSWPQPRLAACNYVIGVLSTVAGEIQYPAKPLSYGVGADVLIHFVPAVPSLHVQLAGTEEFSIGGVVNGAILQHRKSRSVAAPFVDDLRHVSDRSLKRYAQPAGIPADWKFDARMSFVVHQN